MDTSIPPNPADKVAATIQQARRMRDQILQFLEGVKAQTPTGTPPWAVVLAPEMLNQFVVLLTFEHVNKTVARADTRVEREEIDRFLAEHGKEWGAFPAAIRRPAMFADLFGVRFIAAMGIPPGVLAFIPGAPLEPVVVDASRDAHVDGPAAA